MADQMTAVTGGRPRRPNYISQINAMMPHLPALMQAQKSGQYADEMIKLDQDALGLRRNELAMFKDAEKHRRKSEDIGLMLGVGNMGLQAYLGNKRNKALEDIITAGSGATAPVVPAAAGKVAGSAMSAVAPEFFSKEGAGTMKNWTNAASTLRPLLGVAPGYIAGKFAGKNKFAKGAAGAAAGAGTDFVMSGGVSKLIKGEGFSGDPYSMVLSSLLGGAAGIFS